MEAASALLYADEHARFHLVALLPGAWAEPDGRSPPYTDADAADVAHRACAPPPCATRACEAQLPAHAARAALQTRFSVRVRMAARGAVYGRAQTQLTVVIWLCCTWRVPMAAVKI
jgi:hypothetical protein